MIKAIETVYNGYRFRSRLEARWAVVFDALKINYQYEPEGFDLGPLGWYLPDFYIENRRGYPGMFVEVKGCWEDETGLAKWLYFKDNCEEQFGVEMAEVWFRDLELAELTDCGDSVSANDGYLYARILEAASGLDISDEEYNAAIYKGRQARFEHGECG